MAQPSLLHRFFNTRRVRQSRSPLLLEIAQFIHEVSDVAKLAVHRGKANIGNLIKVLEFLHHQRADLLGGNLLLRPLLQRRLNAFRDDLKLGHWYGTLLARRDHSGKDLLPIESFTAAIFLDHHVRNFVDSLVTRKAPAAIQAFTPAADRSTVRSFSRINDLIP